MKKYLLVLLSAVLMMSLLAGCGHQEESSVADDREAVEFMQGETSFEYDWITPLNEFEYQLTPGEYTIEILEKSGAAHGGNIMIEDMSQSDESGAYVIVYESGIHSAPYSETITIEENNCLFITLNQYTRITRNS